MRPTLLSPSLSKANEVKIFNYLNHHLLESSVAHPDARAVVKAAALAPNGPAHQQLRALSHVTVLPGVVQLRV